MFVVIQNVNSEHSVKLFTNRDNATKYVKDMVVKKVTRDLDKISYKDGVITYNDGTKVWYEIIEEEEE